MIKKLLLNSSPIISIANAHLEIVLENAIYDFQITQDVATEVQSKSNGDRAELFISKHKEKILQDVTLKEEIIEWGLGKGETSILSFCMDNSGFIAVIDDKKARKCCETFSIPFIGTLGLLVNAYKRKIIPSLDDAVQKVLYQGLYISPSLIKQILSIK